MYGTFKRTIADWSGRNVLSAQYRSSISFHIYIYADLPKESLFYNLCICNFAIIKNKAIRRGMHLPDPVLQYIAENITSNVRQIEGTVNKILAFQELMGESVDVETVTKAVRDMFKDKTEFLPSPDIIIEEVSKFYNIDNDALRGQGRTKDTALARQIAMYEVRRMTNLSLKEIGKEFEGRDHTTVMHSINRIEKLMKTNPEIAEIIKDINANINAHYE